MKLLAWIFLLSGTFLIGLGQRANREVYEQWVDILLEQVAEGIRQ